MTLSIADDPRFVHGVQLFNDGDYLEASDVFEELFFEGVRDEPDFIRVFLQFSVGIHHAQMGQRRAAVERIEEGLRVAAAVTDTRQVDIHQLSSAMRAAAKAIRSGERPRWPRIS